jgi:hypothetical protein
MADIMMMLGDFIFSVDTAAYQELTRVTEYRWQQQDRVNRAPAQQYIGLGKDEITLTGVIYPHYKGGIGQLDTMRTIAGQGKALLLVDGLGKIHNEWCIVEIEEKQPRHARQGIPLKQEFRLRLVAYGED